MNEGEEFPTTPTAESASRSLNDPWTAFCWMLVSSFVATLLVLVASSAQWRYRDAWAYPKATLDEQSRGIALLLFAATVCGVVAIVVGVKSLSRSIPPLPLGRVFVALLLMVNIGCTLFCLSWLLTTLSDGAFATNLADESLAVSVIQSVLAAL